MTTNPNAEIVRLAWPMLWAAGMLAVRRPASSYEMREFDMAARRKDLARRAKRYAQKKKAAANA
jgi:hypothetical protein